MRLYGFANYYISSLQKGIQGMHVVGDMSVEYPAGSSKDNQYRDWAKNHKTVVMLSGGNSGALQELFEFFQMLEDKGMPYPFVKFHEDEQSLGGALTEVGIILPEEVYNTAYLLRVGKTTIESLKSTGGYADWFFELLQELNNYGLAT